MKKTLMIDSDSIAYAAAYSAESAICWDRTWGELWTVTADAGLAREIIDERIQSLKATLGSGDIMVFVSDRANWRKTIYPLYKDNRKNNRKPILLSAMRKHLVDAHGAIQVAELEADDLIGIAATSGKYPNPIIVSIDKDMHTIPCWHYNPQKPEIGVGEVTNAEADYNHMVQTLSGDTSDGYPGCPGIGPVKARAILASAKPSELWERVVATYEKAGLTAKDAITQARVARILRSSDYDQATGNIRYWKPELIKQ